MTVPVSFELAKLLKEKGINIWSEYKYTDFNGVERLEKEASGMFPFAPTIAEVVMWLYDKYNIWVSVLCDAGRDELFTFKIYSTEIGKEKCLVNGYMHDSPTEAYESAIEYALNYML